MKILVSWLRELAPVEAGIEELADVLTNRGFEVSAVESVPPAAGSDAPDAVLDLEVTTNRPDCLSVAGVARELCTVYDVDLRLPPVGPAADPTDDDAAPGLPVSVDDPERCPRYAAAVAEVGPGPSPGWLAARLRSADVRPINSVVDVTNYVMLELGHPMHAFDLDRLAGGALRIRTAAGGESIRTLDGEPRTLDPDILVIADATRPQAVAGVMGGADSEVSSTTRRVALESAYFQPQTVRRASRRLALSTDASYRFERGADIEAPVVALRRALTLLTEIGAGAGTGGVVDIYGVPWTSPTIRLRHARIGRVLGLTLEPAFVVRTLGRLGFQVSLDPASSDGGPAWRVQVPGFRVDVRREIDLIEEVARHHGYDRLPSTFPALVRPPAPPSPWLRGQQKLRRALIASGCSEAITYGFIEREAASLFASTDGDDVAAIANPLSEKYAVLRPSVLPGLLDSVVRNRRRERRDVRLFELGARFDLTRGETASLGIALTGRGAEEHWSAPDRALDLFDLTGVVEATGAAVGVPIHFEAADHPWLAPGRAAEVWTHGPDGSGSRVGLAGQLHPRIAVARGFPETGDEIYVAELDLEVLTGRGTDPERLTARPVPRHPSVVRDLALVVDRALPAAQLRDTIRSVAPPTLAGVHEFDRYEGKGVPAGSVSLALHLTFRAPDRTLTDTEVQTAVDAIVRELETRHKVVLRS